MLPDAVLELLLLIDIDLDSGNAGPFCHFRQHRFADKAADAGEQNLHDWLRSVVKDSAALAHVEELLGVKPAK